MKAPRDRFFLSLAFGVFAALTAVPWLLIAVPPMGPSSALVWLAVPGIAAYALLIAPSPARGLPAAAVGAGALVAARLLTADPQLLVVSVPLVLAVVRSGLLYRRSPARALVVETFLGVGGLLAARLLVGSTAISWGLAVWAFLLVQSLFFLVADLEPRRAEAPGDPFEAARAEALRLLEP